MTLDNIKYIVILNTKLILVSYWLKHIQSYHAAWDIPDVCINITASRSGAGKDQTILAYWPQDNMGKILIKQFSSQWW